MEPDRERPETLAWQQYLLDVRTAWREGEHRYEELEPWAWARLQTCLRLLKEPSLV